MINNADVRESDNNSETDVNKKYYEIDTLPEENKFSIETSEEVLYEYAQRHRSFLRIEGGLKEEDLTKLEKLEMLKRDFTKKEILEQKRLYEEAAKNVFENHEEISKKYSKPGINPDDLKIYQARGNFNDYVADEFQKPRKTVIAKIEATEDQLNTEIFSNYLDENKNQLTAANLSGSSFKRMKFDTGIVDASTIMVNCDASLCTFNVSRQENIPELAGAKVEGAKLKLPGKIWGSYYKNLDYKDSLKDEQIAEPTKTIEAQKLIIVSLDTLKEFIENNTNGEKSLRQYIGANENDVVSLEDHQVIDDLDFGKADFGKVQFPYTKFQNTNISDAEFVDSSLEKATFDNCAFGDASFTNAKFSAETDFKNNISKKDLKKLVADATDADKIKTSNNGIYVTKDDILKYQSQFNAGTYTQSFRNFMQVEDNIPLLITGINLTNIEFKGGNFSGVYFENTDLSQTTFSEVELSNCLFRRCNLNDVLFNKSNLANTQFGDIEKIDLFKAVTSGNNLEGVTFRETDLDNTEFNGNKVTMGKLPNFESAKNAKLENFSRFVKSENNDNLEEVGIIEFRTLACAQNITFWERNILQPITKVKTYKAVLLAKLTNPANSIYTMTMTLGFVSAIAFLSTFVPSALSTFVPSAMSYQALLVVALPVIKHMYTGIKEANSEVRDIFKDLDNAKTKIDFRNAVNVCSELASNAKIKTEKNLDAIGNYLRKKASALSDIIEMLLPSKQKIIVAVAVGTVVTAALILSGGVGAVPALWLGASVAGITYISHSAINKRAKKMNSGNNELQPKLAERQFKIDMLVQNKKRMVQKIKGFISKSNKPKRDNNVQNNVDNRINNQNRGDRMR